MHRYSSAETYTLDDLQSWEFPGVGLAVLGHPVRHSISPQMHNAALAKLAASEPRFANWRYFRFDIEPETLASALPLFHARGFFGLNLTVPHKEIAVGLVSQIDDNAKTVGAVNTLLRLETGYRGFNTDGYGLSQGIRQTLGTSLTGSNVALLGAGGAARAAAAQCLSDRCRSLTIINRNQERLARLIDELSPFAAAAGIELAGRSPEALALQPGCVIVNATSLGLKADDPTPLQADQIPAGAVCYDMIYNPPETRLMRLASERGGQAANGLSMLIHQGARALEIWTGQPAPVSAMSDAANTALKR